VLSFRPRSRTVLVDGVPCQLTKMESALFAYLLERANQVVSREQLERDVWNLGPRVRSEVVRVTMGRVRAKLRSTVTIETIRGTGWRLVVPEMEEPAVAGGTWSGATYVALVLDHVSPDEVQAVRSALGGRPLLVVIGKGREVLEALDAAAESRTIRGATDDGAVRALSGAG
jgi:hypothetical protein